MGLGRSVSAYFLHNIHAGINILQEIVKNWPRYARFHHFLFISSTHITQRIDPQNLILFSGHGVRMVANPFAREYPVTFSNLNPESMKLCERK